MARPGVRQTLHSVSNNVNKRASILRFYRPALSIFDNASACSLAPLSWRDRPEGVHGGCSRGKWVRCTSASKPGPKLGGREGDRRGPRDRVTRHEDARRESAERVKGARSVWDESRGEFGQLCVCVHDSAMLFYLL